MCTVQYKWIVYVLVSCRKIFLLYKETCVSYLQLSRSIVGRISCASEPILYLMVYYCIVSVYYTLFQIYIFICYTGCCITHDFILRCYLKYNHSEFEVEPVSNQWHSHNQLLFWCSWKCVTCINCICCNFSRNSPF